MPPRREFRYVSIAPVEELRATYAEYQLVSGFEDRKASFRRFLNWQLVDATRMQPADRELALRVLTALSSDPVAGGFLVRIDAERGVVRLASDQALEVQQRRALELVARVPGVTAVEDLMK
jgi:hypothetical protein